MAAEGAVEMIGGGRWGEPDVLVLSVAFDKSTDLVGGLEDGRARCKMKRSCCRKSTWRLPKAVGRAAPAKKGLGKGRPVGT
jgi:hypothetical protein